MRYRPVPPRLVDCERHGTGAELFLVEGDSAALAVTQVRDPGTQAVLAMQGKPLNALRAPAGSVATNPWYRALIDALDGYCVKPATRRAHALAAVDAEAAMQVFASLRALPPQRPLL